MGREKRREWRQKRHRYPSWLASQPSMVAVAWCTGTRKTLLTWTARKAEIAPCSRDKRRPVWPVVQGLARHKAARQVPPSKEQPRGAFTHEPDDCFFLWGSFRKRLIGLFLRALQSPLPIWATDEYEDGGRSARSLSCFFVGGAGPPPQQNA